MTQVSSVRGMSIGQHTDVFHAMSEHHLVEDFTTSLSNETIT